MRRPCEDECAASCGSDGTSGGLGRPGFGGLEGQAENLLRKNLLDPLVNTPGDYFNSVFTYPGLDKERLERSAKNEERFMRDLQSGAIASRFGKAVQEGKIDFSIGKTDFSAR